MCILTIWEVRCPCSEDKKCPIQFFGHLKVYTRREDGSMGYSDWHGRRNVEYEACAEAERKINMEGGPTRRQATTNCENKTYGEAFRAQDQHCWRCLRLRSDAQEDFCHTPTQSNPGTPSTAGNRERSIDEN